MVIPEEPKATILIVEGQAQAPGDMAQTLQGAGYYVTTCSVEGARQVMATEQPNLVIIGMSVPEEKGLAFAHIVKEDPTMAHTPIMFVSSAGGVVAEQIAEVADAYLTTPLPPAVLRLNTRALLRLHAAEQTRWQVSRLLQAVQHSFPRWLAYLDRNLTFVQVNPAFCEGVGKRPEELIGKHFTEVIPENEIVAKRLRRVLETGKAMRLREIPYRAVIQRRRGFNRYLDISFVPVPGESGGVEGVILWAIEVTAEVRLRAEHVEEDRRRRELAETMNQEINHRIKNNLMTVAELLHFQAQTLPEESARVALYDAVARLNVFARIHEQLQSTRTEEVDLLDLLQRVAAVSSSTLPDREREVSVYGEEISLPTQAATNLALAVNELITNGLKHGTPDAQGRLRIIVWLTPHDDRISVLVWSSGNPISEDFDPMAQGGMGLHLVEAIVVRHYGGSFTLCPDREGTVAQVVVHTANLHEG